MKLYIVYETCPLQTMYMKLYKQCVLTFILYMKLALYKQCNKIKLKSRGAVEDITFKVVDEKKIYGQIHGPTFPGNLLLKPRRPSTKDNYLKCFVRKNIMTDQYKCFFFVIFFVLLIAVNKIMVIKLQQKIP